MRATRHWIPWGDAGTLAVVSHMRRLARAGSAHPRVRQLAASIVAGVPGKDGTLQAQVIREWIADRTDFLRDPKGTELLHAPALLSQWVLTRGRVAIDCDDVATWAAALGMAVGLRARFVLVGFGPPPRIPLRHVWAELSDPHHVNWVDVDVTRPAQGLDGLAISRTHIAEV